MGEQQAESADRRVGLLALFLHNEFCCNAHTCGGAKDYVDAARRLYPQLAEHVYPPGERNT